MQEEKRVRFSDAVVVGFAMFATFFGAGNMIFPPFLGNLSGSQWFGGFLCFILADVGLAILTVIAMIRKNGTIWSMFERLGKTPKNLICVFTMTIVGPALCIPRTCATTFEMGVLPFWPEFPAWLFSLLFFGVVFVLIVRRSAVVDIIGKFMTPVLLGALAILIFRGIQAPIGGIASAASVENVAKEGFLAGYQTMDVLGSLAFTMVVIVSVREKGYTTHKSSMRLVGAASVVAAAGLFFVYCGLSYLGATTSTMVLDVNQAGLMVLITELLLGNLGKALLALTVLFACLTTAVGLASACSDFFYEVFRRRVNYIWIVAGVCIVSMVISVVGISTMIALATPMLNVLYPLLLSQIFLSFFDSRIKSNGVYQGAAIGAVVVCVLGVLADFGAPTGFVYLLPLHAYGMYWVIPSALGGLIGGIMGRKPE